MKFFIAVPAFAGAAFAASVPRAKGDACFPMGGSTAPLPSNNTIAGFTEDPIYSSLANNIMTPSGYELAMSNKNCAISSIRYMMFVQMESYDPAACAEVCSRHKGCDSCKLQQYRHYFSPILIRSSQHLRSARPICYPRPSVPQPSAHCCHSLLSVL